MLAAIGTVGSILPAEAGRLLADLADSDDEEIAAAAEEATAEVASDGEDDEEDEWIN